MKPFSIMCRVNKVNLIKNILSLCIVVCLLPAWKGDIYAQTYEFKHTEYTHPVIQASSIVVPGGNAQNHFTAISSTLWTKLFSGNSNNSINHLKIKEMRSFVKFQINHDEALPKVYPSYTYRLYYKIKGYTEPGNDLVSEIQYDTLTISYNPDSINAYQDIHMKTYYGYYKIEVDVIDVYDFTCLYQVNPCATPPVGFLTSATSYALMQKNWNLEIGLEDQKYDKDLKNGLGWKSAVGSAATLNVSKDLPSSTGNILKVKWNVVTGEEPSPAMYELEWTYVDNYKVSFASTAYNISKPTFATLAPNEVRYNFINNATRIITNKSEYNIPLIYKQGFLVYRVRILRPDENQYKNTIYGPWSLSNDQGLVSSVNSNYLYEIGGGYVHMSDLFNWNYQSTFAEEGKNKHVISYFDGLLKNRQTVTQFSSLPEQQIVLQQYYNYEGRVGLQTLPVPLPTTRFGFVNYFAWNSSYAPYTAADFDARQFSPLLPLAGNSSANNYYSANNYFYINDPAFKFLKSLPDAEGYPLIHTKLTPDDGRVAIQGGAGSELQIGKGHETKNYYMSPEQLELNKYFGFNSGKSVFYEKTVTSDPNKQMSFSVNNNEGKVIMTGLMGYPDNYNNSPLLFPIQNPTVPALASIPKVNLLTGMKPEWTGHSRIYNKAYFQEISGSTNFDLSLSLSNFSPCAGSNLSIPLSYSLNLYNEFGQSTSLVNSSIGSIYAGAGTSPCTVATGTLVAGNLVIGKETIDYKVTYNPADVDAAVKMLLYPVDPNPVPFNYVSPYPSCLKTKQSFINAATDNINLNCEDEGTQSKCVEYEQLLMNELFPMSRYGKYKEMQIRDGYYIVGENKGLFAMVGWDETISSTYPYQASTPMDAYTAYSQPIIPLHTPVYQGRPIYRYQVFLRRYGNTQVPNMGGLTTYDLADMDVRDFIEHFNNDIARALLELHPEYCDFKRMYCDQSGLESRLRGIKTYDEAVSLGLNTLNAIALADNTLNSAIGGNTSTPANDLINQKVFYPSSNSWVSKRIDQVVFKRIVCDPDGNGSNNCSNQIDLLSVTDLNNRIAGSLTFIRDRFITELIQQYIGNRQTRMAHYPTKAGQGLAYTCQARILKMELDPTGPKLIKNFYSGDNDDQINTDPTNGFPMNGEQTTTLSANYGINNATAIPLNYIAYNNHESQTYGSYADAIVNNLKNCITTSNGTVNFTALRTAILNSMASSPGNLWKGNLTPGILGNILTTFNIQIDDLCNPYLIDYLPHYGPANKCRDEQFFTDLNAILTSSGIRTNMIDAVRYNTIKYGSFTVNPLSNTFALQLGKAFYTSNTPASFSLNYKIVYNSDHTLCCYIYTGSAANDGSSVKIYLYHVNHDPIKATYNTYNESGGITGTLNTNLGNILCDGSGGNSTPTSTYVTANVSGGSVSQDLVGILSGIPEDNNELSTCLSCQELKTAYADFETQISSPASPIKIMGPGHPLFEDALRSFLNFRFRKQHATQKYIDFIEGCNLSDQYRLNAYYAYLHASTGVGNSPSLPATDAVDNYLKGINPNYRHFYYFVPGNYPISTNITASHLYADFTGFPKDQLRSIKNGLQALSLPSNTLIINDLEGGGSNTNVLGDLFVHYIDGAATYYTSTLNTGAIAPANMNWYPDLCGINTCPGSNNVTMTEQLIYVKDNGQQFPFRQFHFDLVNTSLSNSSLSSLVYKFNKYIMPDPSRGYVKFNKYTSTINTDNLDVTKKEYLNYVYTQSFTPGTLEASRNNLLPVQLKNNIQSGNGYAVNYQNYPYVSYFNANRGGLSGDLYVQKSNTGSAGLADVSNIIAQVKNSTGYHFPSSAGPLTSGSEQVAVSTLYGNKLWYHMINPATRLHRNFWIDMPASLRRTDFRDFGLLSIEIAPAAETVRKFKVRMQKPGGPVMEAYGKADFNLTNQPVSLYEHVMLCDNDDAVVDTGITCYELQLADAYKNAEGSFAKYLDDTRIDFTARFNQHIRTNITDKLEMQTPQSKYIVTLYGYDRAGNLMYTVPPEGVQPIADAKTSLVNDYIENPVSFTRYTGQHYGELPDITPNHKKVTDYYYNSLNQLTKESSPDGGSTQHYYDKAGRELFSQTAKQAVENKFSYSLFDEQSRPVETGQITGYASIKQYASDMLENKFIYDYAAIAGTIMSNSRDEVIHTFYDAAPIALAVQNGMSKQENLRGRVATVARYSRLYGNAVGNTAFTLALHYSYDLSGNVQTMTYDMPMLADIKQQYKRIDYDYDLYSGKVTLVSYNRSFADQFYQRYSYDDDNRITLTETSKDGILWDKDAEYKYYPHGPLARTSLGALQVQGIDFAYTLQGWLKSTNGDSPDPVKDPGGDNTANSAYQKDLVKSTLYYFKNDYKPIDGRDYSNAAGSSMATIPDLDQPGAAAPQSLYNGNIAAAMVIPGYFPSIYTNYKYDQLNRIRSATYKLPDYTATTAAGILKSFSDPIFNGQATQNAGQAGSATTPDDIYRSDYSYDMDGNLTALKRYGLKAAPSAPGHNNGQAYLMDDLEYKYAPNQLNNRLTDYTDAANHSSGFTNDLKYYTGTSPVRLDYDASGNLKTDLSNNLDNITWNPYGKASAIKFSNAKTLSFLYDPMGNRFSKSMINDPDFQHSNEYYIRDASGNILAVYRQLQQYKQQPLTPHLSNAIVSSGTMDTDLPVALSGDKAFSGALVDAIVDDGTDPVFIESQLGARLPGYYLTHSPAVKAALLAGGESLPGNILKAAQEKIYTALGHSFHADFFTPLFADTNQAVRRSHIGLLAADTADMHRMLLEAGSPVATDDPEAFAEVMDDVFGGMSNDSIMAVLDRTMDSSRRSGAAMRLLQQDYSDISAEGWAYGSMHNYLISAILPELDDTDLAAYCDQLYQEDGTWRLGFDELVPPKERLTIIYEENPAEFLGALKSRPHAGEALAEAIDATPSLTAFSLLGRLTADAPSGGYPQLALENVLDYNRFFLSEHHIYGSSRIGMKTYWPREYSYQWDNTKTAGENALVLAGSEFSYRRPWYSRVYNSLIQAGGKVPYGYASTMPVYSERVLGQKRYELTNHLGNVMAVVTDKVTEAKANPADALPATAVRRASLYAAYDYYPFGMLMPERYVEDNTVQCVPMTHTRYITVPVVLDHVEVITPTTTSPIRIIPKTGTLAEYQPQQAGVSPRSGGVLLTPRPSGGVRAAIAFGGPAGGARYAAAGLRLVDVGGTHSIRAELVAYDAGGGEEQVLAQAEPDENGDLSLSGTAERPGTVSVRIRGGIGAQVRLERALLVSYHEEETLDMTTAAVAGRVEDIGGATVSYEGPVAGQSPAESGYVLSRTDQKPPEGVIALAGSVPSGTLVRLRTKVISVNDRDNQGVLVELQQMDVATGKPVTLAEQGVAYGGDVILEKEVQGTGALSVAYTGAANAKVVITAVQLETIDKVQGNYVVMECNEDEVGGKDYRFGFNGQHKDNEIAGTGNHNTAMFWEYDTRLGRRWNVDPVVNPSVSLYSVMEGNPILRNDPNGDYSRVGAWIRNALWGGNGIARQNSGKDKGEWGVRYGQEELTSEGKGFVSHFQTEGSRHQSYGEAVQEYKNNEQQFDFAKEHGQLKQMDDGWHRESDGKNINEPMSLPDKANVLLSNLAIGTLGNAPQLQIVNATKGEITVLGHYPAYTKLASKLGARRFQIPTNVWNKMSAAEQWTANTKFLDRMILRGDNIRLATPLNQVKPGSFYQQELNYLFGKGYNVSSDGLWLVK